MIHFFLILTVWNTLHFLSISRIHTDAFSDIHFSLSSTLSPSTLPLTPSSSFQQWLKSWMYWHSFCYPTICEEDRGESWESGWWGVKDPLCSKPSLVHPMESLYGVIQPFWSLANSCSHTDTFNKVQKVPHILFPLLSHHNKASLEMWQEEEVHRGNSVVWNPLGKVTFACRKDSRTDDGTG